MEEWLTLNWVQEPNTLCQVNFSTNGYTQEASGSKERQNVSSCGKGTHYIHTTAVRAVCSQRWAVSLFWGGILPFLKTSRCQKVGPWTDDDNMVISAFWAFCAHILGQHSWRVLILNHSCLGLLSSFCRILLHDKSISISFLQQLISLQASPEQGWAIILHEVPHVVLDLDERAGKLVREYNTPKWGSEVN